MTKRGYKNPPKEHQFKKGKSGNPKGRPRKKKQPSSDLSLGIMASLHRELGKTISVQENGQHKEITKLEAFSARAPKNPSTFLRVSSRTGRPPTFK